MPRRSGRGVIQPVASRALTSEANSSQSPSAPVCRVQYRGQMPKRSRARITRRRRLIPQGQGELAVQMLEHAFLMVFPEMRNQLGIAMRGEAVSASFEHLLGFGIIEEFAVEDDLDRAILIADRLLAVGQADDAEPAIGQAHAVVLRGSRHRPARGG